MSDYMSLQQMQLIRDRLAADACGVGTVVSSDTFFYMCKRAAADLGVTDDALKKLISKIDENGDDQIQFAEFQDFITSREAKQPGTLMDPAKVCAIRERLKDDKVGVGSEVSIDTFFMMVRYTCSDLGVTDAEILDLIDKIDVNGAVAASLRPRRRRASGRHARPRLRPAAADECDDPMGDDGAALAGPQRQHHRRRARVRPRVAKRVGTPPARDPLVRRRLR